MALYDFIRATFGAPKIPGSKLVPGSELVFTFFTEVHMTLTKFNGYWFMAVWAKI
jgi:hypothetical protein